MIGLDPLGIAQDHVDKWYIHKPKKETHKILCDSKIWTDQPIPARKPKLILINKKKGTYQQVDFAASVDHL